jgi:hypothetical protein
MRSRRLLEGAATTEAKAGYGSRGPGSCGILFKSNGIVLGALGSHGRLCPSYPIGFGSRCIFFLYYIDSFTVEERIGGERPFDICAHALTITTPLIMQTEEVVGIKAYANDCSGFRAILKHRYALVISGTGLLLVSFLADGHSSNQKDKSTGQPSRLGPPFLLTSRHTLTLTIVPTTPIQVHRLQGQ